MTSGKKIQSHPLQSPAWELFRSRMGIDTVRLAGWLITFHKIPHTPWTIGYMPKGPLPTPSMLTKLKALGKEKNAIFIQLEPDAPAQKRAAIEHLEHLLPSHHPLFTKYTFMLDLTKSEEELLAAMHPKTRYNIKVAQKHAVVVSEDNSKEAFASYLALVGETTSRQGFYAHNTTYHQTMWEILRHEGIAHLFTASYNGTILATWILFVWGDTVYYPYGASSRAHREVMAPNLLLWEIVRWAKKRNLKRFDLWGAIGPNPSENDPWYGFHRFKEGFRPELVEFVGSYDLILKPMLYRVYMWADTVRWTLLKLIKT